MSTININVLNSNELKIYTSLSEKQLFHYYEPEAGLFIAESPKVIDRAVKAGYEPLSFLVEDGINDELAKKILTENKGLPRFTAPLNVLSSLTGYHLTNGLLSAMRRKPNPDINPP